jgi:glycine cleavage system aminomethyltransferase T
VSAETASSVRADLSFLAPAVPAAPARGPIAGEAERAGATLGLLGGWQVALSFGAAEEEAVAISASVAVADATHLAVHVLQGPAAEVTAVQPTELRLGSGLALRHEGAWWCPLHPERLMLIGGPPPAAAAAAVGAGAGADGGPGWLDLTSAYGGIRVLGPQARETIARFCALDLREGSAAVGALRPGSVARTPGIVLREAADVYLLLFGLAVSAYVWTVVCDAAVRLGGRPIGSRAVDACGLIGAASDA